MTRTGRFALPAALALLLVPAVIAEGQTNGTRRTQIVSPPTGSQYAADAPSDNTTFSGDGRVVDFMAYDSTATNLVAGDTNGKRDVFLLDRDNSLGSLTGELRRVSVSSRGAQANGDSSRPSIDGDSRRAPHCVVFQSNASNLASGDRSDDSDVFLRDTRRNRTTLVSVGRTNATNGVIDGECEFVSFEAGNVVFVRDLRTRKTFRIGPGSNPDMQGNGKAVAFERAGQVYYQRFVKKFRSRRRGGPYLRKVGRLQLVSAAADNSPGNGISRNPSTDDNGYYVAFESTATNLCVSTCTGISQDRNGGVSDVFRRNVDPGRAPTRDRMQMVSYSHAVDAQGNGPSRNPDMTGAGENVVFESEATNLREASTILEQNVDPNGPLSDVYYWNYPRGRQTGNVSRESRPGRGDENGGAFNGPSTNPSASKRANYIGFTSTQAGQSGEANGDAIADVFMRFLGGE
jgi:hypothetical protein